MHPTGNTPPVSRRWFLRLAGGGAPGINAGLDIYPDLGYSLAILTNVDFGAEVAKYHARELLTA